MAKSKYEVIFARQLARAGLVGFAQEFRFHPSKGWRFDFANQDLMLAVEIEGGIWANGRHNRGSGFVKDCEKYNEAALLGWLVLRIPSTWVATGRDYRPRRKGIELVKRAVSVLLERGA